MTSGTGLTMMRECRCRTKRYKLAENKRCRTEFLSAFRYSGIHACQFSRSMLHDQIHAACSCPCCMSMSILHVHVHVAYPCQCCMSMSILHVHVHVAYPCQCCMSMSVSMYTHVEMQDGPASG
jgi:hypothetical protein